MKKLFIIKSFIVSLLFIQSCVSNNKEHSSNRLQVRDTSSNVIIVPSVIKNSTEKGFTFHQDTVFYHDRKYSGLVYQLYNAKDTMMIASYFNGVEEGAQKKWYPNKQIASDRLYHSGKKIGKHIGFWENGKPKFEFYFLDGEHHGIAKEWYINGNPYKTFHYENGYEQGSQKMWWENGIIKANYVVRNGRRFGLIGLKLCMNKSSIL
jgi:antitoxin component YwqK of YwqJK toxin-antitoxin module